VLDIPILRAERRLEKRRISRDCAKLCYQRFMGVSHFDRIGHWAFRLFLKGCGATVPKLVQTICTVEHSGSASSTALAFDAKRGGAAVCKCEFRMMAVRTGYGPICGQSLVKIQQFAKICLRLRIRIFGWPLNGQQPERHSYVFLCN
jgi:hypothetical protein